MASPSCVSRGIPTPCISTRVSAALWGGEAAGHRASPIPDTQLHSQGILLAWISLKNNPTTQRE